MTAYCAGARASSNLPYDDGNAYVANNLVDGDKTTAWAENVDGDGVGESIQFRFSEPMVLKAMKLISGYDKDVDGWDRWVTNGRLRTFGLSFPDGVTKSFDLGDRRSWQVLPLGEKKTRTVRMTITGVYHAEPSIHHAHDTSVSEVRFTGWAASEVSN